MVKVTVYLWAGQNGPFRIQSHCEECDLTLHLLKDILEKELAGAPVEVEVKPWLSHLWEALRLGGWHPPVVVIDGWRFSQGIVPERARLERILRVRLTATKLKGATRSVPVPKKLTRGTANLQGTSRAAGKVLDTCPVVPESQVRNP